MDHFRKLCGRYLHAAVWQRSSSPRPEIVHLWSLQPPWGHFFSFHSPQKRPFHRCVSVPHLLNRGREDRHINLKIIQKMQEQQDDRADFITEGWSVWSNLSWCFLLYSECNEVTTEWRLCLDTRSTWTLFLHRRCTARTTPVWKVSDINKISSTAHNHSVFPEEFMTTVNDKLCIKKENFTRTWSEMKNGNLFSAQTDMQQVIYTE